MRATAARCASRSRKTGEPRARAAGLSPAAAARAVTLPAEAASAFDLPGGVLEVRPHGRGLIHDTYLVATASAAAPHAILQRINRRAFGRPELIMENLCTLLEHARARGDSGLRFPALYPTHRGEWLHADAEGGLWRAMTYIERTRSYHRPESPRHAQAAGRALGRFHALVGDLDPARLHDTRPDFHHTPRHIERLDRVLAGAEAQRRSAGEVASWLEFIDARRRGADAIEAALARGLIARQVVHGDPKLDNVLFDEGSDEAVSLIDLDTVKPGTVHHDVADCLRSCCNRAGESAAGGQLVRYDLEMCRAGLTGYFDAAGGAARGLRAEDLYEAIRLIPFELGVRFLADHLDGDRYFRIEFAGQNLLRAATQLRLAADVERQRAAIEDLAGELIARAG